MIKNSTIFGLCLSFWKRYLSIRRSKFGYIDKTAFIRYPLFIRGINNIFLYENTHISANSTILTTRAKVVVKKNSGAAEGLTMISGNHYSVVGKYFMDVADEEKPNDLDKDIVIEEDVWIGANVTILSGVNIGRGAVVGAGSICRKSIPPYAIAAGNPARIVGFRFSPDEIIRHEKLLYSNDERLPLDLLEKNYDKYFLNKIKEIKQYFK